ncbi:MULTISPECIES: membrane protein insertase YidC [Candidatus Ichthyocystis]|uniref:membrane protein insertase YidC n=1 Tax=Candidatus Ichthyocystis TaxID=2929841 RepID=UPI000A7CDA12|nr:MULTISPECIES: membrane protein insertase YidC [Ichthyocystis]
METVRLVLIFVLFGSLLGLYQNWNKEYSNNSGYSNSAPIYNPLDVEKKPDVISLMKQKQESTIKPIYVSSSLVNLAIDPKNGNIVSMYLKKYHDQEKGEKEYELLSNQEPVYHSSSFVKIQLPGKDSVVFQPLFSKSNVSYDELSGTSAVVLTGQDRGVNVSATYTISNNSYIIDVVYKITNNSARAINPFLFGLIQRDSYPVHEQSRFVRSYLGAAVYTQSKKFVKIPFSSMDQSHTEMSNEHGWCGFIQHYFVSAWIPDSTKSTTFYAFKEPSSQLYTVGFKQDLGLVEPKSIHYAKSRFYAGPQEQNKLASIAPGLDLVTDYGWSTIIAQPLFKLLSWIQIVTKNWGWAIILLTILIKIVFFPLSAASYRSMAKMKVLAPKIQLLKDTYSSDKIKQQKTIVELFQKEGVNPAAGCLPIIIQVPVFISLYYVLSTSVEIREARWLGWVKDLSSPDPLYILPIALALSTFLQTKMNPPATDPVQAKVMTIMPMVFSVMFFFFPSGLVLYWITNNILSLLQQLYITKKLNKT